MDLDVSRKRGNEEKGVIFDIIGSQKTNLIAVAFMILYYNGEFRYVSAKNCGVKFYGLKPVRD